MTANNNIRPTAEAENTIRVMLIDDHAQTRQVLREVMASDQKLFVVGEAASGEEGLTLAETCTPDVILMDVSMEGMNGVETTRKFKDLGTDAAILIVSNYMNLTLVDAALEAGARGYISKQAAAEQLNEGIRAVDAGKTFVCDRVAQRMT